MDCAENRSQWLAAEEESVVELPLLTFSELLAKMQADYKAWVAAGEVSAIDRDSLEEVILTETEEMKEGAKTLILVELEKEGLDHG